MKAHLRHARLSPKKMNLVAAMVRNLPVTDALATLEKLPKKGASMLYGAIASAVANAENNVQQQRNSLYIKSLIVNKGPAFRRFIPMARGRARPIDKWTSHVSVELGVIVPEVEAEKVEEAKKGRKVGMKREEKPASAKPACRSGRATAGKKPLEAEMVSGPMAQAPGNPAKGTDASDDDPHAGGSHEKQSGATFTPHRQGSRGE